MSTLDLSAHFSRFRAVPGRIHLAAHSHHYWPDVTREAQLQAWDDAARYADEKWEPILAEVVPAVQKGIAAALNLPTPATIAFAPNTLEFVRRLFSLLPARPHILTSDGEFHSFARLAARLEEDGLMSLERVPHEPIATFPERLRGAAARGGHHMVFVSQVLFNAGCTCGDIAALVTAVPDRETIIAIDGYHGFMALPTDLSAVANRIFYIAGGYKYAMAGENACFIHCPPGYGARPRDTGWFAAFGALTGAQRGVPYGADGARFWGATFDPVGLYRLRAVFAWMESIGLTVERIHDHVLALQEQFVAGLRRHNVTALSGAGLLAQMESRDRGHFLTFATPDAGAIHDRLRARNILTDVRGDRLRFGFGVQHTAADIEQAQARVAEALAG